MRYRKIRQWMRDHFVRNYGCLPNAKGTVMLRIELATEVACKHSSERRPLTLSIIHARVNTRTPGSMLAAWRERRIG